MQDQSPKGRGRPRTGVQPMTSAERSRRYRERMRAEGQTNHTISLSPEIIQGLEEWARLVDKQKTIDDKVEATAAFALNKFLEPGKQDLMAAFANPDNKPLGRILALLSAMGVQAMQNELEKDLKARPSRAR